MKKIVILVTSLLASNHLLASEDKHIISSSSLILMPSLNGNLERSTHYSHGSAAHYSAVRYSKVIKKNNIKKILLQPDVMSKIENIIENHFDNDHIKSKCDQLQITYNELFCIDDIRVEKKCYSIDFIIHFYSKNGHTHSPYCFYLAEDGSCAYRVEPYFKTEKIENLNWLEQLLNLIK